MAREVSDEEEHIYMKKVVDTLNDVTLPVITKAYISYISPDESYSTIVTRWRLPNYGLDRSDEYSILYKYDRDVNHLYKVSSTLETNTMMIETVSPSLKQRAVIKKHANETSKKDEYILEIWSETKRVKTINLTSLDKHGQVHSDMLFGTLVWSPDESRLVYVAEKKIVKVTGYFEVVPDNSDADKPIRGEQYDYEDNWGEQLSDVINTVLCVFSLSDDSLIVVEGIPAGLCPFHPQFGPNNSLVFSAFVSSPFRLGVIYCENRECGIYSVNIGDSETVVELTKNDNITANYHAQLNKRETRMVFFQRQLTGFGDPHRGNHSLMIYSFTDGSTKHLSDEFRYGDKIFPLFVTGNNVKYKYWLPDDVHIAIPNTFDGTCYVCFLDTESAIVKSMIECSDYLGMYKGIFLASYEKLNSEESTLILIDCNGGDPRNLIIGKEEHVIVNELESDSLVVHGVRSFYLMPKVHPDSNHSFPLFVSPHGGPHSAFTNNYSRNARLMCKLGYAVLLINYRGSIGFTVESLKSLPGHIGTQDVNDVQDIVRKFISLKEDVIDKENIFICGSSHGGFLSLHLIGQFPDFYKAACLRNPVVEICSMSISSDIPDWTYFESGLNYTQDLILSNDAAINMLSKSPLNYITNIKAPVLLCVGDKDARVPPSQGKHLFRILKANRKVVRMLLYPNDSHALSNARTDGDNIINICKWFYQHGSHSK